MSEEKIIRFNFQAAKTKLKEARTKAISVTSERLKGAQQSIIDRSSERKNQVMSSLVEKGIQLTKKQLGALEKFKENRPK